MNDISTQRAIELLAEAERAAATSGERLAQLEHSRKLAVRSALISGDHDQADRLSDQLESARRDHEKATSALAAARDLVREAREAEGFDRATLARQRVAKALVEMQTAAREADESFGKALAALARAHAAETEAHDVCRTRLNQVWGGLLIRSGVVRSVREHLASLSAITPPSPKMWATDNAAQSATRIRTASEL